MKGTETIQRYRTHKKEVQTDNPLAEQNIQHLKDDTAEMVKKIALLEGAKRKLLGEGLGSCSVEELQQIEQQLERSVSSVRARKMQAFQEQIDGLKEQERILSTENAKLREKYGIKPWQESNDDTETAQCTESSEKSDVETELFIGLPDGRTKRASLQK